MALWRASSQTAVVGEREAEEEKQRVVASTQTEEVEVQPCSEIFLAELQREFAHGSERRVLKSESNGYR